jgi:two-component system, OmpR family, KDP operon response regulator KdpE
MTEGIKLLVIDDELAIRRFLQISLREQGYKVHEATTGVEGLQMVTTIHPDLVILDLGLGDLDGLTVLKRLREWSEVPVIILTVRAADSDKVALLDAGANDYLTKPFSAAELQARIRAALRHTKSAVEEPIFRCDQMEIDFTSHIVKKSGREIKLTVTEYEMLKLLVRNADRLITQRQLLKEIWGINAIEHTHYLRVYIGQLRKKLEDDPSRPQHIITEPGMGYRFRTESA